MVSRLKLQVKSIFFHKLHFTLYVMRATRSNTKSILPGLDNNKGLDINTVSEFEKKQNEELPPPSPPKTKPKTVRRGKQLPLLRAAKKKSPTNKKKTPSATPPKPAALPPPQPRPGDDESSFPGSGDERLSSPSPASVPQVRSKYSRLRKKRKELLPPEESPKKNVTTLSVCRKSPRLAASAKKKKRQPEFRKRLPRVDFMSISARGSLTKIQLVSANYEHLPVPASNYTRKPGQSRDSIKCQLHSYLAKTGIVGRVCVCETCGVALCTRCYKPWHVVDDLEQFKYRMSELYAYCKTL